MPNPTIAARMSIASRSLMDVLNDFASNGGTVPMHSGTRWPRILRGRFSSNEVVTATQAERTI